MFAPAHIFNRVPPQALAIGQQEHVRLWQWQQRGQQIKRANRAMNMKTLAARFHAYKSTPPRQVHVSNSTSAPTRTSSTRTLEHNSNAAKEIRCSEAFRSVPFHCEKSTSSLQLRAYRRGGHVRLTGAACVGSVRNAQRASQQTAGQQQRDSPPHSRAPMPRCHHRSATTDQRRETFRRARGGSRR